MTTSKASVLPPSDTEDKERASTIIRACIWCCLAWLAINGVIGWNLHNWRMVAVAALALVMVVFWLVALRQVSGSNMIRGVTTFSGSGLALLLVMGFLVPELSRLYGFSTFIFLAFGLSYMGKRGSIATVVCAVVVASTVMTLSSVFQWSSGLSGNFVRWADLSGMLLTLSVDAMLFVMLRHTLETRSERLVAAEYMAVAERTERELAEHSEHVKSELLSNMSHEIRTPMNAVIAMNDLILETDLNASQRDMAETIKAGSEHLLVIINDILDLSRFESGQMKLENTTFDPVETVEHALELNAPQAATKQLFLGHVIGAEVPRAVVGDPARVTQILVNLVGNAVKFTEAGSVVVAVDLVRDADDRCSLRFTVEDTGPGISEEDSKRLFQPFSQLGSSSARRIGGTGLGLAICRKLAELMGGAVGFRSTVGEGSAFSFEASFQKSGVPMVSLPRGGVRVVVATGREVVRRSLLAHGQRLGYDVRTVGQPSQAASVFEGREPTHVLIDVVGDDRSARDEAADLRRLLQGDAVAIGLLLSRPGSYLPEQSASSPISCSLGAPLRERSLLRFFQGGTDQQGAPRPEGTTIRVNAELRVLLVEDNPVNQKVTSLMLDSLGVRADLATDGSEAVAMVEERDYDLILMDVQMPVMGGLEASRRIRTLVGGSRRPRIVALTASVLPDQVQACLAAGMDEVISKPVRLQQLVQVIDEASSEVVSFEANAHLGEL